MAITYWKQKKRAKITADQEEKEEGELPTFGRVQVDCTACA